ncbi:MAG: hypothetical protein ABIP75_05875 [Pyrinomonadaceae bacterium]
MTQPNPKLVPCPDCAHPCSAAAKTCPNCGRPKEEPTPATAPDKLYDYVFSHSFMMVGLCLTLIGLARLVEGLKHVSSLADELLAANAVFFLISGFITYLALKDPSARTRRRKGRIGDLIFTSGIVCLVGICCVIALSLI